MENLQNQYLFLIIAALALVLWFTTSKAGRAQFEAFNVQMQSGKYVPMIHGPSRRRWWHGSEENGIGTDDGAGMSFPTYPGFVTVPPNKSNWKRFVDTVCQMGIYYVVTPIQFKKQVADDLINQIYTWAQAHVDTTGADDLWYFRDVVLNLDKVRSDKSVGVSDMKINECIGWLKNEAGRNKDCVVDAIKSGNTKALTQCVGVAPLVILGMMDKDTYTFDMGSTAMNAVLTSDVQQAIIGRFRALKHQINSYYAYRQSISGDLLNLSQQNYQTLQTSMVNVMDLVKQCCGILNDVFLAVYALSKNQLISVNDPQLTFLKQCAATLLVAIAACNGTILAEYFHNTGVHAAEMLGWVQLYYLMYMHKNMMVVAQGKSKGTMLPSIKSGLEYDVDGEPAMEKKTGTSATAVLKGNLSVALEPWGLAGSVLHNFVV